MIIACYEMIIARQIQVDTSTSWSSQNGSLPDLLYQHRQGVKKVVKNNEKQLKQQHQNR